MTEGGDEFVIESIITFSRTRNRFFLSWQGYPPSDNTWEPYSSFYDQDTPLKFLKKLKSLGVVCDACVRVAKSSSTVTPANRCRCAQRSPSPICTLGKRAFDMMKQADAKFSLSKGELFCTRAWHSFSQRSLDVTSLFSVTGSRKFLLKPRHFGPLQQTKTFS